MHHGPGSPRPRRLLVEWGPGRAVTAQLRVPTASRSVGILLAPGAGAGRQHPFMTGLGERLAAAGLVVMTFDYAYMEAGRRLPDAMALLRECHRAAARRLGDIVESVVLAGKSMGGRVASHVAADGERAAGLVCYGYPLLPAGKREPRSTAHLAGVECPMLFLSGTRDRMAPPQLLESVVAGLPAATLHLVADADHGFAVTKRSGRDPDEVLDELADVTAAWIRARIGDG